MLKASSMSSGNRASRSLFHVLDGQCGERLRGVLATVVLLLGYLLLALIALVVLVSRKGGCHTEIPFGPALVLGAVCAVTLL